MAGTSQLIQIDVAPPVRQPKPDWLRAKAPVGENFHNLKQLARGMGLHTVCESAQCPNIGECWNHHTATFMLLGDICTRRCGFCAVPKGRPEPIDWDEPRRVAEAVATLGLKHAVVTSVNRDDDNVGGARIFAETIRQIRELVPGCWVEVLIPDFQGLDEALKIVLEAKPDVLNHNTESVPRLYRAVRSGARYERTLRLLENAKKFSPGMVTKSGVMVGLGESFDELVEVFRDLGERACRPSHCRSVLAAFQGPSADRALLHSRRVPAAEDRSPAIRFPPCGIGSAGALQLPRPRAGGGHLYRPSIGVHVARLQKTLKRMVRYFLGFSRTALISSRVSSSIWSALL